MNKYLMEAVQMFKEIVKDLDVSQIPIRYIACASFTNEFGIEEMVYGEDLTALLARESPYDYLKQQEINVLLDLRLLTVDMAAEVSIIFENIFSEFRK